jgi:hypothetical protein
VNPHTEEEINERHTKRNLEVPQEELLRVNSNLFKWYKECVHVEGQHF